MLLTESPPDPVALVNALLASSLSPRQLAAAFNLSAVQLLEWAEDPAVRARLAALDQLSDLALRLRSAEARHTALNILEKVAQSAADPIEQRRAATALLRLATRPNVPGVPRAASTSLPKPASNSGDSDATPTSPPRPIIDAPTPESATPPPPTAARPRPRTLPSRRLYPDQAVARILNAIAENDYPVADTGIATLHAFLSADARASTPHLDDFIDSVRDGPAAPLIDLTEATLEKPQTYGKLSTVHVRIAAADGQPLRFAFKLVRESAGARRDCWLIDAILPAPPPDDERDDQPP